MPLLMPCLGMAEFKAMSDRKMLILEDSFVTVPLARGPQRALEELVRAHQVAADAALAPFGLTANEIRMPTFERVVYEGETAAARRERVNSTPGGES